MTFSLFNQYLECIGMLEAREQLKMLPLYSWVMAEGKDRDKIRKDIFSRANPEFMKKKVESISLSDVARMINGR